MSHMKAVERLGLRPWSVSKIKKSDITRVRKKSSARPSRMKKTSARGRHLGNQKKPLRSIDSEQTWALVED